MGATHYIIEKYDGRDRKDPEVLKHLRQMVIEADDLYLNP